MKIFRKPKKENNLTLVFDIGSASIGAALFQAGENGIPKIIHSVREVIPVHEQIDFDNFIFLTMKTLQIVAGKICLAHLCAPERIFCTLSSPWYVSQTRVITFTKNSPFMFSKKFADNLIEKEIKLFEKEYINGSDSVDNMRVLELKNIQTIVDGKVQGKITEQKIKDIEITLFISMSGELFLNKIEDVISQHFHEKKIYFSSLTTNTFSLVRDMFSDKNNFLLLDVGGEVTDLSMVKKDILVDYISFPLGYNYLFRSVGEALGCTLGEAKSYISLYKDKHMAESMGIKFEIIMDRLKKDWLIKFEESILGLANDLPIPATIFITIDKNLNNFFTEIIQSEKFNKDILTKNKFEIIPLNTQNLHGLATFNEGVNRDSFLTIESIYINRFLS